MSGTDSTRRAAGRARIRLLGPPGLVSTNTTARPLERRDAALLAMLALDGALARSRAAAALWCDAEPARARNNLRQRLFRLRRAAGVELVVGDDTLRLGDAVDHDLQEPLAVLANDPSALAAGLLAGHDHGDLDELERWVDQARQRWRDRVAAALEQLAQQHEDAGRHADALRYARRLLAEEPLAEAAARRVMRLHYLLGDVPAALQVFDQLCMRLRHDLGVAADAATHALATLLRQAGAARAATSAATAPSASPGLLRPPRLVGRDHAWSVVTQALAVGRGVLLLGGPPGIGKTRLLSEIVALRPQALASGARQGDAATPWATLGRLLQMMLDAVGPPDETWVRAELARVAPALGPAPSGATDHLRLRQALERFMQHAIAQGASLLLMDDLQYADEATLDALPALADLAQSAGCLWVWAARQDEWPGALAQWMASSAATRVWREDLCALDEASVGELVASLGIGPLDAPQWAAALQRHTGGNPLFILETLREHLAMGAVSGAPERPPMRSSAQPPARLPPPPSMRQLLSARLARLSEPARTLARLAAVAGQDFDADLAASALDWPPWQLADPWLELERADILRGNRFTHDLLQELALLSVPEAVSPSLHRCVAEVLEARCGDAARRGHHWSVAGHWAHAGHCFLQAAERARRASQSRLEAELCQQAAAALDQAGDAGAAFAARELQVYASRYAVPLEQQLALAQRLNDSARTPHERMAAREAMATILIEDFRDEAIIAAAAEARRLAVELGEPLRELRASRLEARALARANRHAQALALLQAYLPRARALGGDALGARLVAEFGCVLMSCNRYREGAALFDASHAAAKALDDVALQLECHEHRAWAQACAGDIEAAAASYEAARALAPRLGIRRQPAMVGLAILARTYKELGRFDTALALLEELQHEQGRQARLEVAATTEADLSSVWLWLGQPARAHAVLRAVDGQASATMQRGYWLALGRVQQALGQDPLPSFERALHCGRQEGGLYGRGVASCELAFVLPPSEAVTLARQALAESEAVELELTSWPLRAALCDALRRAGCVQQAADEARGLLAYFARRPPFVLFPPRYWGVAAAALAAAGDLAAADAGRQRAEHWVRHVAQVPPPWIEGFMQHAQAAIHNAAVTPRS